MHGNALVRPLDLAETNERARAAMAKTGEGAGISLSIHLLHFCCTQATQEKTFDAYPNRLNQAKSSFLRMRILFAKPAKTSAKPAGSEIPECRTNRSSLAFHTCAPSGERAKAFLEISTKSYRAFTGILDNAISL